jgi:hypothetical protein
MDDAAKAFFHKALEKVVPSLAHDGREKVIVQVLDHLFDHPWNDHELKSSMIGNLAADLGLDEQVPEEYQEPEEEYGDEQYGD